MRQKKKKREKNRQIEVLKRVIGGGLWLAFFLILGILMLKAVNVLHDFGYRLFAEAPDDGVEIPVDFSVEAGEPATSVASRLKEMGLIDNEWIFLAQKYLFDQDIYAGVHRLHSNMTTLEILGVLSAPQERIK